jgi:putative transposase
LVPELMQRFGCSQRNALRVVKMSASTYLYKSVRKDESALKMRIKEITETRVHYGYRRVHVLLRREGHTDNVKRIYRLYREEGLSLRLKRPRRNRPPSCASPSSWPTPSTRSGAWISWPTRCSTGASCAC